MRLTVSIVFLLFSQLAQALEAPPSLQFDVVRFEVAGANPFSKSRTTSLLKPYLGRHYSLDGLSAAIADFERDLKNEGYSFHRVILEPQSLQGGVVKLVVHEFKVGQLKVSGNKFFDEANIRNSLPSLQEGKAPNTRLLNMSLSLANNHPDKSMQLVFKEGEVPNTIDVGLNIADKSPHTTYLQLSNTGTEETGESRLGLGYQYSNLFNKDHIASVNYSTSSEKPDQVAQWAMSYSMPFYDLADQLSIYYSDSAIETSAPYEDTGQFFDITGAGTVLGFRYLYTLKKIKGYKQNVTFGYDDKSFDNQIVIGNITVPGTNELSSKPLSVQYELARTTSVNPYSVRISFHQNLVDDQTAYDKEARMPDTDWSLFRYGGRYDLKLETAFVRFKLNGQEASTPLISGEQFGVGGANSVRGYGEHSILGDKGYSLSIEYWKTYAQRSWSWLAFYDLAHVAYVEELSSSIPKQQDPASAGAGVRWNVNKQFRISADLAYVLEDVGEIESGDSKLHVDMVYLF